MKRGAKAKRPSPRKKPGAAIPSSGARPARTRHVTRQGAAARGKRRLEASFKSLETLGELMAQALAMEMEAAQRYADLADAMDTHSNREVAALFRSMANIEGKHAAQIMAAMGWTEPPDAALGKASWESFEEPETAPSDELHYLMQPYHALRLALANEQRAERFFAHLVRAAGTDSVRKAARELQAEEREHIALVKAWMKKTPKPGRYWAHDPDPARYTD